MDKKMLVIPMTLDDKDIEKIKLGNKFQKQLLPFGTLKHPMDLNTEIEITEELVDGIVSVFNAKVFDSVPILSGTHNNEKIESTIGVVNSVSKITNFTNSLKNGLYGGLEITDEKILEKIKTKTSDGKSLISGVSVSIGPVSTKEGKSYDAALWHVTVTNYPWVTGLSDFVELSRTNNNLFLPARQLSLENLSQRVSDVINAYYDIEPDYSKYVREVHDEFIIVKDKIGLLRITYEMNNDGVTFGEEETGSSTICTIGG